MPYTPTLEAALFDLENAMIECETASIALKNIGKIDTDMVMHVTSRLEAATARLNKAHEYARDAQYRADTAALVERGRM